MSCEICVINYTVSENLFNGISKEFQNRIEKINELKKLVN